MSIEQLQLLKALNQRVPRYTSYPTPYEWGRLSPNLYIEKLQELEQNAPLALYIHIPFCKKMCLFCGCSVVLNRKAENEKRYVEALCQEIQLVAHSLGKKRRVVQLHLGGGTPTQLSGALLKRLMQSLEAGFEIDYTQEISIEVDPRTVVEDGGEKLQLLFQLGFNRISFGVQDTSAAVQKAVRRDQTLEVTQKTYHWARLLGFKAIHLDLIYGLPFQTQESFRTTLEEILNLPSAPPDRIALFSFAYLPQLKRHQQALSPTTLPTSEEKFAIYSQSRQLLTELGYLAIGMDHFALTTDALAEAYRHKKLQRNFQGYSVKCAESLLGFGLTAIGYLEGAYFQNTKELSDYYHHLERHSLAVFRGKLLSHEDRLRKWVIHTLMCNFLLDKAEFAQLFGLCFDQHFSSLLPVLEEKEREGLLQNHTKALLISPLGELFIRSIASLFDAYLAPSCRFSHSI